MASPFQWIRRPVDVNGIPICQEMRWKQALTHRLFALNNRQVAAGEALLRRALNYAPMFAPDRKGCVILIGAAPSGCRRRLEEVREFRKLQKQTH